MSRQTIIDKSPYTSDTSLELERIEAERIKEERVSGDATENKTADENTDNDDKLDGGIDSKVD